MIHYEPLLLTAWIAGPGWSCETVYETVYAVWCPTW